ncbi:HPr family phosphocarrier protein [Alicyclobacillus acidiphilus]|uniref:HPr family phosphocarrier protein n=1 Tax=Alicyclobacillus acidiphilus TaxID=182455 RepID=UPI00083410DC|nr:HPr family phosphocarrier protein [Alicyclobacillus acidiphilus]
MVERKVVVALAQGLAARPAAEFVKRASSFTSSVRIGKHDQFVDAKSILGVMSMAISHGEEIVVQVDGADEDAAIEALVELLTSTSV